MVYGMATVASNDSDVGFISCMIREGMPRRMVAERAKSTTLKLTIAIDLSRQPM
jgi:hypothetical protein